MADTRNENELLASRLSKLDPDKFVTLCRMHLSFILDLDSDDLERIGEYYDRLKDKTKKNMASAINLKPRLLGNKDEDPSICKQLTDSQAVYELMDYLSLDINLKQEGLFRKSGKISRQDELLRHIKNGSCLNLKVGEYSAHDCAGVLKKILSELPEPLLSEPHYCVHYQIADLCQPTFSPEQKLVAMGRQVEALQLLIWLLPSKNRRILKDLLELLQKVSRNQAGNKMDAVNLATLFAPHILCPRKMSAEEIRNNSGKMIKIVAFMIDNASELFKIPQRLAKDLQILWNSKTESKSNDNSTTSPEDSFSQSFDEDAITTVTTFCERQPIGHDNTNATELALAELYAHVQALPESSKKKQLIKQFNKENGNGTPLSERHRNHQRSRSLKKSLKKHLFGRNRHMSSDILGESDSNICETNIMGMQEMDTDDTCQLTNVKYYSCSGSPVAGSEIKMFSQASDAKYNCESETTCDQEDKHEGCCPATCQFLNSIRAHALFKNLPKFAPFHAELTGSRQRGNSSLPLSEFVIITQITSKPMYLETAL